MQAKEKIDKCDGINRQKQWQLTSARDAVGATDASDGAMYAAASVLLSFYIDGFVFFLENPAKDK